MAVPETYRKGITGEYYTRTIFFVSVLDAIYQSAVCYFIPYVMWSLFPGTSWNGLDMTNLLLYGTTIGAVVVFPESLYSYGHEQRLPAAGIGSRAASESDLRAMGFERGRTGRATLPTDRRAGAYRPDEVPAELMREDVLA